ncbi:MAG: 7-cyano-7-deazaguanine synthase QueC [Planctomycetota bacterium]|jgi:7-cyano-7-deazaguanine synthase
MTALSRTAVVLLSGGLDSATTLAIARDAGFSCHAISFDYGQRQQAELAAAGRVAAALGASAHVIVPIDLRAFGGSALTDDAIDVPKQGRPLPEGAGGVRSLLPEGEGGGAIPVTYVPARNTVFLSIALAYAETRDITDIFIGVNAIDYSGYPDCRPEYIDAFERMANLATRMGVEGRRVTIHTPLIKLSKADIIRRGLDLGVDYGLTLSCYDPGERGTPCGRCDSCRLRAAGFEAAGVADPVATAPQP